MTIKQITELIKVVGGDTKANELQSFESWADAEQHFFPVGEMTEADWHNERYQLEDYFQFIELPNGRLIGKEI